MASVLRFVCLCSVVGNGLREKTLKSLQAELLAAYGYPRLAITFANLNKVIATRESSDALGMLVTTRCVEYV